MAFKWPVLILDALQTLLYSILFEAIVIILTLCTGRELRSDMMHELKWLMCNRHRIKLTSVWFQSYALFHCIFPDFGVSGNKTPSYVTQSQNLKRETELGRDTTIGDAGSRQHTQKCGIAHRCDLISSKVTLRFHLATQFRNWKAF